MPFANPDKEAIVAAGMSHFPPGTTLTVVFTSWSDRFECFSEHQVEKRNTAFALFSAGRMEGRGRSDEHPRSRSSVFRFCLERILALTDLGVQYVWETRYDEQELLRRFKNPVLFVRMSETNPRPDALSFPFMFLSRVFSDREASIFSSNSPEWHFNRCVAVVTHELFHYFGANHESESPMLFASFLPDWDKIARVGDNAHSFAMLSSKYNTGANLMADVWYLLRNQDSRAPDSVADLATDYDVNSITGSPAAAIALFFKPADAAVERFAPVLPGTYESSVPTQADISWIRSMYDPNRKVLIPNIKKTRAFVRIPPETLLPPPELKKIRECALFIEEVRNDSPSELRSYILNIQPPAVGAFRTSAVRILPPPSPPSPPHPSSPSFPPSDQDVPGESDDSAESYISGTTSSTNDAPVQPQPPPAPKKEKCKCVCQ